MTAEQKKDFTRKISQANSTELIVILYDITLGYMEEAIKNMEEGDIERASVQISFAKKCIEEMIATLHFEYDLATVLHRIYLSMKKSPYRNYMNRRPCPEDRVIYLMIVDKSEKITALYDTMMQSEYGELLKIITYKHSNKFLRIKSLNNKYFYTSTYLK